MWKALCAIAAFSLLCGCATGASSYTPVAGKSLNDFPTDMNACSMEVAKLPVTVLGATNPLFVAASQEDFQQKCMAAKGWLIQ